MYNKPKVTTGWETTNPNGFKIICQREITLIRLGVLFQPEHQVLSSSAQRTIAPPALQAPGPFGDLLAHTGAPTLTKTIHLLLSARGFPILSCLNSKQGERGRNTAEGRGERTPHPERWHYLLGGTPQLVRNGHSIRWPGKEMWGTGRNRDSCRPPPETPGSTEGGGLPPSPTERGRPGARRRPPGEAQGTVPIRGRSQGGRETSSSHRKPPEGGSNFPPPGTECPQPAGQERGSSGLPHTPPAPRAPRRPAAPRRPSHPATCSSLRPSAISINVSSCPPRARGPPSVLPGGGGSPRGRGSRRPGPGVLRPFGAPPAGTRPAPPRAAFPRSVRSLAPATGIIKQKNFCKLSSPGTRGFLKPGPPPLRTCARPGSEAGAGRRGADEGTPRFPGRPWVRRSARRGPVPPRALSGLPSPATLSPPQAKKLVVTSGASAV